MNNLCDLVQKDKECRYCEICEELYPDNKFPDESGYPKDGCPGEDKCLDPWNSFCEGEEIGSWV